MITYSATRVETEGGLKPPPQFNRLERIDIATATSSEDMQINIRKNIARGLRRFHQLPEFKQIKGKDRHIALVGGGPSLKDNLNKLREFDTIIACGSVHDYLIDNNIIPAYSAICDPDAISANYLKKPHKDVKYLVASCVHEKVVEALEGYQIIMWHCHSDTNMPLIIDLEGKAGNGYEYEGVGGGCTVGLRSISLALMMGWNNLDFFGFDSCMGEKGECHSYDLADPDLEMLGIGKTYEIKCGYYGPGQKTYVCAGYQIAQATVFKDFYLAHHQYFNPVFHGKGLLPDVMEEIRKITTVPKEKLQ